MSGQRPACPRPIDSVSLARPCTSSAGRALYEPEQEETLSGIRGWMLIAVVILCLTVSSGIGATDPPVILGANSIEYAGGDPPNCFGPSILFDYGVRDIRPRVRNQLAAMAAAGMKSLRVFLVFDYDTSENPFFVPARSGRLEEPFRTNLANYLSDIRAAGFRRVTLAFDPRQSVDPAARYGSYDPSTFEATWGLIRDTRPLLKQYGPSDTRVDLLNEGAETGRPELGSWVARMYPRYVDEFGAEDVTVSMGFWTGAARLVETLRSTGRPLPRWFDVHPRYTASEALEDLRRVDADLDAAGLSQPLVVGEEKYNDAVVAQAVAQFMQTSGRAVEEVMEWPADTVGLGGQSRCINPPYRIDGYAKVLLGAAPSTTLTALVTDRRTSFLTPQGTPVTALLSGSYTIVVTDRSKKRGFAFAGRATTRKFTGRATWRVTLTPGLYGGVSVLKDV